MANGGDEIGAFVSIASLLIGLGLIVAIREGIVSKCADRIRKILGNVKAPNINRSVGVMLIGLCTFALSFIALPIYANDYDPSDQIIRRSWGVALAIAIFLIGLFHWTAKTPPK